MRQLTNSNGKKLAVVDQLSQARETHSLSDLRPSSKIRYLLVHTRDVNKRNARINTNIPLIKTNLVPQSFNGVERDEYASSLIAIYEMQDVRPLVDVYVFSYMRTCALYDSTAKTIGFDEIRVRYRQQRRTITWHVILNHLSGKPMKEYIADQIFKLIKEEGRVFFFEDFIEDLKEIDLIRIAGPRISSDRLKTWLAIQPEKPQAYS